jgi:hypothetical protein
VLLHAVIYVSVGLHNRTGSLGAGPYTPKVRERFQKVQALENTIPIAQDVGIGKTQRQKERPGAKIGTFWATVSLCFHFRFWRGAGDLTFYVRKPRWWV